MSPSATGSGNGAANGHATASNGTQTSIQQRLRPGIYVPTVAFFRRDADESVDVETTKAHAVRLAKTGIAGIVTQGSNGEAVHLDREERQVITRATREALDAAGRSDLPVIVGCGSQSTRETIQFCRDAAASGGSHAIVLPPAYYGGLLGTSHIITHFRAVADASPVPVLIYNYPGACSGLDLSSDTILALAEHPNIAGVKLTCGNTGKLARVVDGAASRGLEFSVFGGSVDFTLQTLAVGGHGIIGGTANVAPHACVDVMRQWEAGNHESARKLQATVAHGDWTAIQGGFVSVKAALDKYYGYGGLPRLPCRLLEGEALAKQTAGFSDLVQLERQYEATASKK